MNKKVITLIRFARVAPIGDVGTEPTPPIGLAYLSAMCKEAETAEIYGIDASGKNLNNFFNIPQYKMRGNGLTAEEVINLIDPNTSIFGVTSMFTHEWLYIRDCIKLLKRKTCGRLPNDVIQVGPRVPAGDGPQGTPFTPPRCSQV